MRLITRTIIGGIMLSMSLIPPAFTQETQWTPIGPDGGFLLSITIAPGSPNVLYAGSDIYGGIYKSTDSGENWTFTGLLSELGHMIDIKIHPDVSDIVYAACGKGGLFKTTDGGLNWNCLFKREEMVFSVGIDPNNPDVVYTGIIVDTVDQYALFRSTDAGVTWPDSSFQGNPVLEICFDPDSLNTIYTGTSGGVHRSTDAGTSWTPCGPPAPSATIQSLVIVDFNTYYAGTFADERDEGTVYKTTDGGGTWNTVYALGTSVWGLSADPGNGSIVYMAAGSNMFGQEGVFKTTDGGDNWFPVNNGLMDRMARDVKVDPASPHTVYAATDGLGGVYKSVDGAATWTQVTSGMRYTLIQAMDFDVSHTLFAAVGWGTYRDIPAIFRSRDEGASWEPLAVVPSPYYMTSIWDIVAHPDTADLIYVGGTSHYSNTVDEASRGLLYRSHDGGDTWEALWTPEGIWILCLTIDPVTKNIYAGTAGGDTTQIYKVYKSTDSGNTWEETSGWSTPANSIFDIAVDPSSPNKLYAATGGAIFGSNDYGDNWTPLAIIPFAYTLLIDPNAPNTIYVGSGGPYADNGGIYKSTDWGITWATIGLEEHAISSLVGRFGTGNTIYAGTGAKFMETNGTGVFRSTDSGISWEPMHSGLSSPFILSMLLDPASPNTIYAGTMGGGICKATVETGVETTEKNLPEDVPFLLSNFPNPFNATTRITFHIPAAGHVNIDIYDISGRFITTLIDEQLQAGHHRIGWEGTDRYGVKVGTGLYFVHLYSGELRKTRKITLMK